MAFLYRGGPQSPREEPANSTYSNPLSPPRNPNRLSGGMMTGDVRAGLTRRFTTNALPTLTPIGQQRRQAAGDYTQQSAYGRKPAPSESAVRRYEGLLAAQRELQRQLDSIDPETRREVEAGQRHEDSITQMMASSEPTSPPEYANAFPSAFSKPNRYSATSLTSPPGLNARPNRSSAHITSPPGGFARPYTSSGATTSGLPSQSVPASRRHSDDEDEDDFIYGGYDTAFHRAAANPNRNSMPVSSYDHRKRNSDISSFLGPVNTTGFLFDDDEDKTSTLQSKSTTASPPDSKTFLQVQHTADGFPKLIRREENGELSSVALDLALSQGVISQQQLTDRATATRHRISLPPSALSGNFNIAPLNGILANADNKAPANNRRSMEVKFTPETKRPGLMASPPSQVSNGAGLKAQSSYSTNDLPTLKSINGDSSAALKLASPPSQASTLAGSSSPERNNSSVSHISSPSINGKVNRQSQDFTSVTKAEDIKNAFHSPQQFSLHANAPSFGPDQQNNQMPFNQASMAPQFAQPQQQNFYTGYSSMNMLANGFNNMNMGGYGAQQGQWQNQMSNNMPNQMPNQMPMYQQNGGFGGFQQQQQQFPQQNGQASAGAGRFGGDNNQGNNGPRMSVQQRRQAQEDAQARFNSVKMEELKGEIHGLCKDQHGCRFLQRKLDERDEENVQIIFDEVNGHIIELMTDPFGNYLCQKLLESTNDDQRTVLIQNAMPAMTKIALNQHGTRALQKMIEFISTKQQTEMMIEALRFDVVQLIQDLNGNHVIQKCLNHLTPEDAQFIFEAVGAHCVIVGTHRHGCCVLQRCIDHASGLQKGTLVDQIIDNAFTLVQDPFGNYVVQYILDLNEPSFTEPLCRSFVSNVVFLSKQKFSSNVIEKCIRCAGPEIKRDLIQEIIVPIELEKLLRDSFANYVVQTAMDFSDEGTKAMLVESIRPILPSIRHSPHGRRLATKIQEYDGTSSTANSNPSSALPSGVITPNDSVNTSPNGSLPFAAQSAPTGRGNRSGFIGAPPQFGSAMSTGNGQFPVGNFNMGGQNDPNANIGGIISPTPQRSHAHSNSMFTSSEQHMYQNNFANPQFTGLGRQAPPYGHF